MTKLSLTALMLASSLALPLAAQESGNTAGSEQGGLSLGQPEVGSTYIRETFNDWEMRCIVTPENQPDPCQLYQLLTDDQGNSVAEFNLFDVPDATFDELRSAGRLVICYFSAGSFEEWRDDDGHERAHRT